MKLKKNTRIGIQLITHRTSEMDVARPVCYLAKDLPGILTQGHMMVAPNLSMFNPPGP